MEMPRCAAGRWCVYMLQRIGTDIDLLSSQGDRSLYVGISNNVPKRLASHNAGNAPATRGSQWSMIALAKCENKEQAVILERWLKCGESRKKRTAFLVECKLAGTWIDGNTSMVVDKSQEWHTNRQLLRGFGVKGD